MGKLGLAYSTIPHPETSLWGQEAQPRSLSAQYYKTIAMDSCEVGCSGVFLPVSQAVRLVVRADQPRLLTTS